MKEIKLSDELRKRIEPLTESVEEGEIMMRSGAKRSRIATAEIRRILSEEHPEVAGKDWSFNHVTGVVTIQD